MGYQPTVESGTEARIAELMEFLTPEQRTSIVTEAREWVEAHTPYIPHGKLKGIGCDCATFILCVYHSLGLVPEIDIGEYSIQAHLHSADTQYADTILKYSDEIREPEALPGDLVLWRVARAFAHGGIVVAFPQVIHSMNKHGVIYSDANVDDFLKGRPRRFFRRNFLKPHQGDI
jgi:cell wall-associated NlpC family hydrolase